MHADLVRKLVGSRLRPVQGSARRRAHVSTRWCRRSERAVNGRAVYTHSTKPSTAMWWTNNEGTICWCVGPADKIGGTEMWAFVESAGASPVEANARDWSVWSFNSQCWEQQSGVKVLCLDEPPSPQVPVTQSEKERERVIVEEMKSRPQSASVPPAPAGVHGWTAQPSVSR